MNKIISYASGGLGNILLPLSSCMFLSKKTNRKLAVCWEPTFACMASFNDLFDDSSIEVISKNELLFLKNLEIYGSLSDINHDSFLFKNDSFQKLTIDSRVLSVNEFNFENKHENIIIYHNNIIPNINKEEVLKEIKNLKWKKSILEIINKNILELNIDKSVYGISVRATDFNNDISFYIEEIKKIIMMDKSALFFVSSDSVEWEDKICKMFPLNCFKRIKSSYVIKKDENLDTWNNNILRSLDSVVNSVIDAHLLAKTNFKIYNNHSSFAQLINYI